MSYRRIAVYTALVLALSPVFAGAAAPAAPKRPAAVGGVTLSAEDQAFLDARDAAQRENQERLNQLASQLRTHPLVSYVEYWQLAARLRLDDPAIANEVSNFFARYPETYIADRLRLDWALALAVRGDFTGLEREAAKLVWGTDDGQLRCYLALARYRSAVGQQADLLAREARQLLASTRDSAGDGCVELTEALLTDGRISAWERVRALVEQNQLPTAKRIGARALDPSGKPVDPKTLAQAIDRPSAWLTAHERRLTTVQRELAMVAIARLARDKPEEAAEFANAMNLLFTPEQRGIVWGRIGHMAALRLMPEASEWYGRGGDQVGVGPDAVRATEVLEWQARAALRAGDWPLLKRAVDRMPTQLRGDPTWIYWYGRALQQEGRTPEAHDQYARIAARFHFYGKLAAEELGLPIVVPPKAPPPAPVEVEALRLNLGFARALKFYDLGLRAEGNREWNWQLRGMSDRQLLAAAEFARSRGQLDRMINTSERTQGEYDFSQRFPVPYRDAMVQFSAPLGLDENWIYGLIRQESRFIMDARSSVGATGLMQLMPSTARYVARKLNVPNYSPARLNELEVNLQLGTGYLKMVLDDLDGSTVLATAAYNAGPGRPRAWRATLVQPVEGAIFAETIPFSETRDYVKKVMSNSVYYAALSENREQSLKSRLGVIAPKIAGTTDLP